jgi:hypothetical protein
MEHHMRGVKTNVDLDHKEFTAQDKQNDSQKYNA